MPGPGYVAMAVYHPDPLLLERQLASLRGQTISDWRCLVGIDGADPSTLQLVERLVAGDERFTVVEYPDNVGVYRHFERLLLDVPRDVAWIGLADQDDFWYPDKFEKLVPELQREGATCAFGQANLVDRKGRGLGVTQRRAGSLAEILLRNQVTGGMSLFRADVVRGAHPFPRATDIAIHDHWLGVCAAAWGELRLVDEPLQDYVQHGGNVLGEPRQPPLRESLARARRTGGLGAQVKRIVRERWGWRVAMARSLGSFPLAPSDRRLVGSIAKGRRTPAVLRLVVSSLRSRRISLRDAGGFVAAIVLWPVMGGGADAR